MIVDDPPKHRKILKYAPFPPIKNQLCECLSEDHTIEVGCTHCPVKNCCLVSKFNHTDTLTFDTIVRHEKPKRKGKHIYWQEHPFKSIFIVKSGAIKTYRISESGRERVLGFHLPGDIVGLDGLHTDKYADSAVALDTTAVCEISFDDFSALFGKIKGLQEQFLSAMYGEVILEQKKHFLDSKTVEEKVAAFIIDLSNRYRHVPISGDSFKLLMTRREIANYLGMAMESVSRALTRFQQRGWLVISGHVISIKNKKAISNLLVDCQEELNL